MFNFPRLQPLHYKERMSDSEGEEVVSGEEGEEGEDQEDQEEDEEEEEEVDQTTGEPM